MIRWKKLLGENAIVLMIVPANGPASVVFCVLAAGGTQKSAHLEHQDHFSCQTALLTVAYIAQTSMPVFAFCARIKIVYYVKKNTRLSHFCIT